MEGISTLRFFDQHAVIRFGSPAHNALSSALLQDIITQIESVHDLDIKTLLIESEGDRTFCAGADLKELISIENEVDATNFFYQFARLLLAVRNCPHTIITKVQGKAVGGGLGLIAASDYVIASSFAQIRLSELVNGIGPFVIGPALERKLGIAAFQHLSLRPAVWHTSDWALDKGLFNEVHTDKEALDKSIDAKIKELNSYSSSALRAIKKMIWQSTPSWDDLLKERAAISGKLLMTEESKAALRTKE